MYEGGQCFWFIQYLNLRGPPAGPPIGPGNGLELVPFAVAFVKNQNSKIPKSGPNTSSGIHAWIGTAWLQNKAKMKSNIMDEGLIKLTPKIQLNGTKFVQKYVKHMFSSDLLFVLSDISCSDSFRWKNCVKLSIRKICFCALIKKGPILLQKSIKNQIEESSSFIIFEFSCQK